MAFLVANVIWANGDCDALCNETAGQRSKDLAQTKVYVNYAQYAHAKSKGGSMKQSELSFKRNDKLG